MASENLQIDANTKNVLGAITNDVNEFIKNLRVNPITGRLLVDAHVTSTNTSMGDTIPGGTAGSVLFLGLGSTLAQDNTHFFWDDTNNRLGLGNNTPSATLDLVGTFQYVDGSQVANFVLISDASGNATWNNLATNSTFVSNLIANTTFTTNLANNSNFLTTLTSNTTFIDDITSIVTTEGSITVQDEGVSLPTLATTLNFTGAGVTATGSGATKTITVSSTAGGTVTGVSVATANGFAGTSDTDPINPTLTLETTESGVLRGDGTAISGIADPATDTLFGWDDTDSSNTYIDIGTGLSYDHGTHTLYTEAFVESVTGLNTDNTDPQNPVVRVSVDGSTVIGSGTPASPLTAPGGTLSMKLCSVFETLTRFVTDLSGGTLTFGALGATLSTTATANRYASVYMGTDMNSLYLGSPRFTAQFNLSAFAGTGSGYVGIDLIAAAGAGINFALQDHVGFKILIVAGVATLYATQSSGGTETPSSALTTILAGDTIDVIAQMNGSASVNYYWRKNGGTLSAPTNLATNVPVPPGNGQFFNAAISNNNTANNQVLNVHGFSYER